MKPNSLTASFANNAIWSVLLQLVNVVAGFVVPRIIIATYGSEANGLIASLTQMIGYISLAEAGVSAAAIFALYKPLSENDYERVSIIVTAAKRFYYKAGALFVVGSILLSVIYPIVVDCGGFAGDQIALLVLSLAASGFLDFFTLAKYRVLLTADQKNWIIQCSTIIYKVLYLIVIASLAYFKMSLVLVYAVAIIPIIVRTAILVTYAKRHYSNICFDAVADGYKIEQHWDAFFLQVLGVVQAGYPILILTFVSDNLDIVSIFSIYLLVGNGVQQLCAVVTNGTQAVFGNILVSGGKERIGRSYAEIGAMMGIVASVAAGTSLILLVPFVSLYVQDVADINYIDPSLGFLMMINVFLYLLKLPEGLMVVAAGRYRESRPYVIIQTSILLAGGTLGVFMGGTTGLMIGVCASNLYAAAYLLFFVPERITGTKKIETFKRYCVTVVSFTPAIIVFFLAGPFSVSSWGVWVALLCVILGFSLIGSILVFVVFEMGTMKLLARHAKTLLRSLTSRWNC